MEKSEVDLGMIRIIGHENKVIKVKAHGKPSELKTINILTLETEEKLFLSSITKYGHRISRILPIKSEKQLYFHKIQKKIQFG